MPAPELRAYVVWIPILPGDDAAAAERAAASVHDARATQLWDGGRALGDALGRVLGLPARGAGRAYGVAWDVYLLYPRGARWPGAAGELTRPAMWMQQLDDVGPDVAPELDGRALRAEVEASLVAR